MRYVSTRGASVSLPFNDVLLAGLAFDGGLFVPSEWPALPVGAFDRFADMPYAEVAIEVMWPYVAGTMPQDDFAAIVNDAYAAFDHPDVVPLRDLGDGIFLAELFHGPTLAFKDLALQLVGRLFEYELSRRGERVTIVGATSGDTGSAAVEACRDREAIEIFILHPRGRISEVQRRQMTTVLSLNVHNVAIEGTFDDCQELVKSLFGHEEFRNRHRLSAVNSINWARVMAQIVYYVKVAAVLGRGAESVAFTVPTGNFGNVFAGYCAQKMGTPISQLVVASNRNDIVTRFLETGTMRVGEVHPTLSPSMDIQISSNFERLLFELFDRDGRRVAETMARFRTDGEFTLGADTMAMLRTTWSGGRIDDDQTLDIIRSTWTNQHLLIDPHTAVGLGVAVACRRDPSVPMVCLATAHPAKFPDAVEEATGVRPPLPERMADLFDRPERYKILPNSLDALESHIDTTLLGVAP
ncbi:MAG: threonine synthase [Acidimicrobiales bacterium]|nr:threonine synthase [Acidimicrobiales bacterium]